MKSSSLVFAAVAVVLYTTYGAFAGSVNYNTSSPQGLNGLNEQNTVALDAFGCKVQAQPEVAAAEQPSIPNLSDADVGNMLAPSKTDMDALNTGAGLQAMQGQLPIQNLTSLLGQVVGDGSSTPVAPQGPMQDDLVGEGSLPQLSPAEQLARALSGPGMSSQLGPDLTGPTYGDPCAGQ